MTRQHTKDLLKEIFSKQAPEINFDQLDSSKPLREQVEIDSYDLYQLMVKISEQFQVYIPDSQISQMKTLDQLISFINPEILPPLE